MGKLEDKLFAILHNGQWRHHPVGDTVGQSFCAELKAAAGYVVVPVGDEAVERVARAICAAENGDWENLRQSFTSEYLKLAQAAIDAMLEQDT